MKKQLFGAGIWHFATYVDRYATDGYGGPGLALVGQGIARPFEAVLSQALLEPAFPR